MNRREQARKIHDEVTELAVKYDERIVTIVLEDGEPFPAPRIGDWTVMNDRAVVIVQNVEGVNPAEVMSAGDFSDMISVDAFDAPLETIESKPEGTTESTASGTG